MLINIRHGLLELTNYPGIKKSSIIFNNDIIITSGIILESHLKKYDNTNRITQNDMIYENLNEFQAINSGYERFKFLNSYNFEIVFDEENIRSKTKTLTKYKAEILYIFNCPDISKSIGNIFGDFHPNNNNNDIDIEIFNRNLHKILISSFIILRIVRSPDKNMKNIHNFLHQMKTYIKFIGIVNKLDDILTISTPFGMEQFYKTINIGKCSNVFGKNNCLFLISNNLVEGCEGSAIFNSKLRLVGMIISTTLQRQNNVANLTLAASFSSLFKEFLIQIGEKNIRNGCFWREPNRETWENSIVLISNHNSWGTGTFVKIGNKKFLLTCSHVVKNANNNKAFCYYIKGNFEAVIIWRNETTNQPYDIAILSCPTNIPEQFFAKISNERPKIGQNIYSAGFPLFAYLGEDVFKPSIFEGRIIKYPRGMIISDGSLQAGQSGGPIFNENGNILGICVSNVRDEMKNTIYPNINMAIPLWEIKTILEKYSKTDDIQVLSGLIENDCKDIWSLETPFIQSKL